ncbi:MAG: hypothetical protein GIKADHBN_00434 [Phycisphaerales bacterium]|nr:hypothetical protein [Phycisphaerales bacterium]
MFWTQRTHADARHTPRTPGSQRPTRATEMFCEQEYLTLGQAARIAPGRPSTNCLWRWARTGVLARSGERVKLQHVRAGGKILTKAAWISEFCAKLAHADAAYFDSKQAAARALPPRDQRFAPTAAKVDAARAARHEDGKSLDAELDAEGL